MPNWGCHEYDHAPQFTSFGRADQRRLHRVGPIHLLVDLGQHHRRDVFLAANGPAVGNDHSNSRPKQMEGSTWLETKQLTH